MAEAEHSRREQAVRFQAALDNLDQGVCIFDGALRLQACNRRFVDLLTLPAALVDAGVHFADLMRHLVERGDFGLVHGDVDEIVARRVEAAQRGARFYSERTTRDGRVLAVRASPLPSDGFVVVYTDITERSLAEAFTVERHNELEARVNQQILELRTVNEELRANLRRLEEASAARAVSEARLRLICDAIPAAIAYIDDRRTVGFANRRFGELFGRRSDQLIAKSVRKIFGKKLWSELSPHLDKAFLGRPETFEHTYRPQKDTATITRNILVPELADGGRVLGLFVLSLDVTEEKRAERALHEAQKMSAIGQLAGGLAHDFNNLLTIIVGNLGALNERVDGETAEEYVAPAVRASHRGVDITRRLLAFARQQSLEPSPVDVSAAIAATAQLLRRSLPSSIAIDCSAAGPGWPALVDPAQLENAIVNLALNARDAMPEGGVLAFATAYERVGDDARIAPGEYVSITVSDSGAGIAPEILSRVFEPFFTTKPFGSGSGLGLSMVFGFVRQSRGDIRIVSEVGKGTSVTLFLPRAEDVVSVVPVVSAARAGDRGDGAAAAGRDQLVLLVEDDPDVRHAVRRQLVELGYQVLEARDGEDARALLAAAAPISALVSDVVMPGAVNGLGLAAEARQLIPGIRIVLMSGFTNFASSGHGWFDEKQVLRKPFDKEELARALLQGGS
jgi:PAS domain S-box-containing protein